MSEPRLLKPADAPCLVELSRQAGWNQTQADWLRLLELCPEGCFGIEAGGRVAASTTAICYGRDLAWIGMVLTHQEHRGHGYASRLMEHTLGWLRARGVARIKLDATEMGQPIYAKLGFEDECRIERWKRPGGGERPPDAASVAAYQPDEAFDLEAFGAPRGALIRALSAGESASVPGEGYAMGRAGAVASYFGPCVARSEGAARRLLSWFLSRHAQDDIFWDLLPSNPHAAALAREHGFAPVRRLMRMAMALSPAADPIPRQKGSVFAIAGFEYG